MRPGAFTAQQAVRSGRAGHLARAAGLAALLAATAEAGQAPGPSDVVAETLDEQDLGAPGQLAASEDEGIPADIRINVENKVPEASIIVTASNVADRHEMARIAQLAEGATGPVTVPRGTWLMTVGYSRKGGDGLYRYACWLFKPSALKDGSTLVGEFVGENGRGECRYMP
jgi:hypothetical protein